MTSEFTFLILPGKSLPDALSSQYIEAFNTFHSHWSIAFQEIYGADFSFSSNDFTRQDYVQALFHKDKCVAVDCVREVDLLNPADLEDSWFKPWSKSQLHQFAEAGIRRALVNSYFTVHKDYRKANFGEGQISVSYLLGCLSVLHQLELGVPLMFGMMRNDRSMHSLGESWGSRTIQANVLHNKTPTNLVVFETENVHLALKKFPPIAFQIFANKINHYTHTGETHGKAA